MYRVWTAQSTRECPFRDGNGFIGAALAARSPGSLPPAKSVVVARAFARSLWRLLRVIANRRPVAGHPVFPAVRAGRRHNPPSSGARQTREMPGGRQDPANDVTPTRHGEACARFATAQ